MNIRKAESNDKEAIFRLLRVLATSFAPIEDACFSGIDHLISDDEANFVVAEIDTELVGYCLAFTHMTLYANGPVAWVEEVVVMDDHRRAGIGREMMQEQEKWASERGCKLVALATRRAAPFYKSLDYEESATYFRKIL